MRKQISVTMILLIAVMAVGASACTKEAGQPLTSAWANYENEEYGFRLHYPADWHKDDEPYENTVVGFWTSSGTGAYYEVHVMIIAGSCQACNLEENVDAAREGYQSEVGTTVLNDRYIEVQGRRGHEFILSDDMGIWRDVYFVANNKDYMLSCLAPQNKYSQYEGIFEEIVNSFVIR